MTSKYEKEITSFQKKCLEFINEVLARLSIQMDKLDLIQENNTSYYKKNTFIIKGVLVF